MTQGNSTLWTYIHIVIYHMQYPTICSAVRSVVISLKVSVTFYIAANTKSNIFYQSSCTKIYVLCIYTLGCFTTKSKMLPYIAHGTSICNGVYGLIYSDTEWFSITVFEKEFHFFFGV